MTSFSLPEFAKLTPRIARTMRELSQMEAYYQAHSDELLTGEWGALAAVSSGIHNVYNGIEDILLSIAKDIDDYVPTEAPRIRTSLTRWRQRLREHGPLF